MVVREIEGVCDKIWCSAAYTALFLVLFVIVVAVVVVVIVIILSNSLLPCLHNR